MTTSKNRTYTFLTIAVCFLAVSQPVLGQSSVPSNSNPSPDSPFFVPPKPGQLTDPPYLVQEPELRGSISNKTAPRYRIGESEASTRPTRLIEFEQRAFESSPLIGKLQSRLEALKGKRIQAGLIPNPRVGVTGEDMFDNGNGGRFGVLYGQEVVRGNKLGLSQRVVDAEIEALQRQLDVAGFRILTDVRGRYFDVILAERKVAFAKSLETMLQKIVDFSEALINAQEVAKTALLQSEIELEKAIVIRKQAENERVAALSQLASLINEPSLPAGEIRGDIQQIPVLDDIETLFDQILVTSPELQSLVANIETERRRYQRACVEAVPNVTWQTGLSYDTASDHVVGGFQIAMPLPSTNLNQGAIQQARHRVAAAERAVEQKVLQIRKRLIDEYQKLNDAKILVEAYANSILPKSKESLDLNMTGYRQGETSFLAVLTAQRTYFEVQLEYLDRLKELRRRFVRIEGNLLSDSLDQN